MPSGPELGVEVAGGEPSSVPSPQGAAESAMRASLSLVLLGVGLLPVSAGAVGVGLPSSSSPGDAMLTFSMRSLPPSDCEAPVGSGDEEVVVCGRRQDERYRLPEAFRDGGSSRAGTSWAARSRAFQEDSRYSDTTTGPGAYLNVQRQAVHQWRLEREEMARQRSALAKQVELAE